MLEVAYNSIFVKTQNLYFMTIKLIDQSTREEFGQINLDFLPRKEEYIKFENQIYSVSKVLHSESFVQLQVSKMVKNTWDGTIDWD